MSSRHCFNAAAAAGALMLLLPAAAAAQGCCTPGTSPLGGLGGQPLRPWSAEYGVAFDGYDLRQAYRGTRKVPDPGRRHSRVTRVVTYARVGLPGQAVVLLEVPYDYRMRELPIPSPAGEVMVRHSNDAFGDLSTLLLIRAIPRAGISSWGLTLARG